MSIKSIHRARFVTLDGMRGVAALLVMLFHVGLIYPLWTPAEAYLAVDMFFALSGFVLARTNDHRFAAGLRWQGFMWRRLVRLYPLFLFGCLLGLVERIVTSGATFSHIVEAVWPNLALLPSLTILDKPRLFVVNGVAWSLFCEFWIANLAYGLLWKWIDARSLAAALLVFAICLALVDHHFRSLDVGSLRSTAIGGMARVAFSFTAGIALWRVYDRYGCPISVPSWVILSLLVVLLSLSIRGERSHMLYDFVAVALIFPAMIYAGAGAHERRPAIGAFMGDVSYALYITHVPILLIWGQVLPASGGWSAAIAACFVACAIVTAMALDRFYDPHGRRLIESLPRQFRI